MPDPASRFNPDGVHASSEVVDADAYEWRDGDWRGRPLSDAVIYELHVGTFTPQGTYAAAAERLDYLAELGVTAIELMPLAATPGRWNWGYDGVLPFAPHAPYGRPDDLKRFVDAAHERGLMVLLDVVYNHFGPDGNYLGHYAPQFFTARHTTPWGNAINFDDESSGVVRQFFIHNALYWLEEYHFDGLRLDAVHAIVDDSDPSFLRELAAAVHGLQTGRAVHLVLENDRNDAALLARDVARRPRAYTAQWNDDFHHALHVLLTGETHGHYADYAAPGAQLLRSLREGFAYQGEHSAHRGATRGSPSAELPPEAFVNFLQNHDQIGNRPDAARLWMLLDRRACSRPKRCSRCCRRRSCCSWATSCTRRAASRSFATSTGELARAVTEGRRAEFAEPVARRAMAIRAGSRDRSRACRRRARLDGRDARAAQGALERARHRLAVRRRELRRGCPRAPPAGRCSGRPRSTARWSLADGTTLDARRESRGQRPSRRRPRRAASRLLATTATVGGEWPPWYVEWALE